MSIPRTTVWNEFRHEHSDPEVARIYPNGIHVALADGLRSNGIDTVRTATLDEPEHGLSAAVLDETDVLLWWGHIAHEEVDDAIVDRVQRRVLGGMGLIVLHSGHNSKIFHRLMGTSADLKWRESDDTEVVWNVAPGHPITRGIGERFIIGREEMYGEFFDVPQPEELVFISWFTGGEVFRSGACYRRGAGRIFYFRPGHETYPTYHQDEVRTVIANAVRWAAPTVPAQLGFGNPGPLMPGARSDASPALPRRP